MWVFVCRFICSRPRFVALWTGDSSEIRVPTTTVANAYRSVRKAPRNDRRGCTQSGGDVLSHKDETCRCSGDRNVDGAQSKRVGKSRPRQPACRDGLECLTWKPGRSVRGDPDDDGLDRKEVGKSNDDGRYRRAEEKSGDKTENGEAESSQEEVAERPGEVGDAGRRCPCCCRHMAGMSHNEGSERRDQRCKNDGTDHEGQHGQGLSGEQDRPSRLAHEKLAEGTQAVLASYLACGDTEGDDSQEHGSPIDAMDQAVRLSQLRQAWKVSAAVGKRLGKEKEREE